MTVAEGSSSSLVRASVLMSVGTVLSRATGLLRLIAITAALGVAEGRLADTYNLANMVPNILYMLILGGVLTSVFVPVFVELLEKEGRERAWEAASAVINVAVVTLTGIIALGVLAAPVIAELYASRLEGSQAQLQREVLGFLLPLLLPQVIFYGVSAMAAGLLNANKRFGAPMYAPVLNNLAVIAVFWGFHRAYGTVGLDADKGQLAIIGLGTTVGVILMASAQIPFLRGLGRYRPTLSLRHPSVKKVARLSVFVVGFVVVSQLGFLIVQWLANAQRGGYTAYFAAYTFFLLPISLFSLSVTTALLPDMSSHAVNERWDEFRQRASVGVRATLFLVVPAAAGYVVLGHRILEALLRNGVVTSSSIDLVEGVLLLLALGMPQVAVFSLLVRTFYAMQDTRSPFLLACGGVLVTAAINIPLFAAMEVNGLALGHTIGNTLLVFIAARLLAARTSGLEGGRIWASTIRITIASALMGAAVWVLDRGLVSVLGSTRTVVALVIVGSEIAFGVAAYLGAAKLAGVEELTYLRRLWPLRATPSEVEVHGVVP